MWSLTLVGLTIALFVLPLLPALQEWYTSRRDVKPLKIISSHDGNVRYFAENFRAFIKPEIEALLSHKPTVEPPGTYQVIDVDGRFEPNQEELQSRVTQRILIALHALKIPNGFTFAREIYGLQSIIGGDSNCFRAVLAEGDLSIGPNSVALRWVHAQIVRVSQGCRILGRLSADKSVFLKTDCKFTRIHAPCVRFESGLLPAPAESTSESTSAAEQQAVVHCFKYDVDDIERWLVKGNLEIPENGEWLGDIVVLGNAIIGPGAKIMGSVKAHGTLRVARNATVTGPLISSKRLIIDKACCLGGPVVADQQIDIGVGTVVGTAEKPTTITAPVIHVADAVVVYGTVWAREYGTTLSVL